MNNFHILLSGGSLRGTIASLGLIEGLDDSLLKKTKTIEGVSGGGLLILLLLYYRNVSKVEKVLKDKLNKGLIEDISRKDIQESLKESGDDFAKYFGKLVTDKLFTTDKDFNNLKNQFTPKPIIASVSGNYHKTNKNNFNLKGWYEFSPNNSRFINRKDLKNPNVNISDVVSATTSAFSMEIGRYLQKYLPNIDNNSLANIILSYLDYSNVFRIGKHNLMDAGHYLEMPLPSLIYHANNKDLSKISALCLDSTSDQKSLLNAINILKEEDKEKLPVQSILKFYNNQSSLNNNSDDNIKIKTFRETGKITIHLILLSEDVLYSSYKTKYSKSEFSKLKNYTKNKTKQLLNKLNIK